MSDPPSEASESLIGTVEDAVFRSEDGRFGVLKVKEDRAPQPSVVVGDVARLNPGETAKFYGRWNTHASYGRRFQVSTFIPILPSSAEGIARFLGSGLIPGVGPSLAERIVRRFGDGTLDVIRTHSARLTEVSGVGRKRAEAIAAVVRSRRSEADAMAFLHGVGVGPSLTRRLFQRYGEHAAKAVREDPYRALDDVRGAGFRTADSIGRALGFDPGDSRRARGAVLEVLRTMQERGHAFIAEPQLVERAATLGLDDAATRRAIVELQVRGDIQVEEHAVYPAALYRAECRVAASFARLLAAPVTPSTVSIEPRRSSDASLSLRQREAVRLALEHHVIVLTGGPGTGKTTTVKSMVAAQEACGKRVVLSAPTGRAARRLSETTSRPAHTIHRLLEWNPARGSFSRDSRNPIEADVVLVDEASMLDLPLAEALLEAISTGTTLVLVGDADQLPPIGAGHVLREALASRVLPTVRLTEVFRQASESAIVRGAHAILNGRMPEFTPPGTHGSGDFFCVRAQDPETIVTRVLETLKRIEKAYNLSARDDVQVLSPMRRGPLGIDRLNETLASTQNPSRGEGGPRLRAGDKVMQLRNDYEREVFNGDLGYINRLEGNSAYVHIDHREVTYDEESLDSLDLAYACTVHKAQGSEFPAVVIVLHGSHAPLLSRSLLYTAVTRAQKLVVIIGDDEMVRRAALRAPKTAPNSKLADRMRALLHAPSASNTATMPS